MALLEVEGLVKHFVAERSIFGRALAHVKAVDGVSFSLDAGKTLALVGESGCGKSTVSRLVLRLIEPDAGAIRFEGRDLLALDATALRAFRREAQVIFQDPYASLNPRMTVGQILTEPLALHNLVPPARRRERVEEILRLVGLEPRLARRYPHEFSGGQRQRFAGFDMKAHAVDRFDEGGRPPEQRARGSEMLDEIFYFEQGGHDTSLSSGALMQRDQ